MKYRKIFLIIAVLLAVMAGIHLFSGEDDWICVHGQWIPHGHPSAPAPTSICRWYYLRM